MLKIILSYFIAILVGYSFFLFVYAFLPYNLLAMGCGFAVSHLILNKFGQ